MAKLVVLYPHPADPVEFDRRYREEHVPLCQDKLVGMALTASHVESATAAKSPYYLAGEISAPSIDALKQFLQTPDGQQVAGHAFAISSGGSPIVLLADNTTYQL